MGRGGGGELKTSPFLAQNDTVSQPLQDAMGIVSVALTNSLKFQVGFFFSRLDSQEIYWMSLSVTSDSKLLSCDD